MMLPRARLAGRGRGAWRSVFAWDDVGVRVDAGDPQAEALQAAPGRVDLHIELAPVPSLAALPRPPRPHGERADEAEEIGPERVDGADRVRLPDRVVAEGRERDGGDDAWTPSGVGASRL